jgi:serine-type D-Ala-D-Ala carboxypeptidase/endopeptidase (penicillin-binding protein 4)
MFRMKYICTITWLFLVLQVSFSQSLWERIDHKVKSLSQDPQMKHAIFSLYVVDAKTGALIYGRNEEMGLAPASCQKLFTSAAAFALLGPEFRYQTDLLAEGKIDRGELEGNIIFKGFGDPTLGSWRWKNTQEKTVINEILGALCEAHIEKISGNVILDGRAFSIQSIPDGWIWQDIGNYYGAGAWAINWHENQYDLVLRPGNAVGKSTTLDTPVMAHGIELRNGIKTGAKASGDNGYIYLAPRSSSGFTLGSIPISQQRFTIAGSIPDPPRQLSFVLDSAFRANQIVLQGSFCDWSDRLDSESVSPTRQTVIFTHLSPPLDSMNYWFLKKSINLYGEALLKTLAYKKSGFGETDAGVEILRNFWASQGIESSSVNIMDGSGLSPQNRVTAKALVHVLQYAVSQPWFAAFFDALPEINGIRMKSGSINGVRSYAGYQTARTGEQFQFAIMVNNFDGPSEEIVKKMWGILDELK